MYSLIGQELRKLGISPRTLEPGFDSFPSTNAMMPMFPLEGPVDESPPVLRKRLRIVIGAHTPHGTPYIVGSHHIARELKRMGHTVFHIPIPLGPQDLFISNQSNVKRLRWDGWKTTRRDLDPNQNDQFLLTCLPWMLVRRLGSRVAERLGFGDLTFPNVKALGNIDILIVDHPKQFWLVKMLKPALLLYRPTDAYSFPGHKDDKVYKQIERWLLRQSDGVILTASETAARMLSLCDGFQPPPMRVLENGVDMAAFVADPELQPPPALNDLFSPRLLYIGTFDERIDYNFIISSASELPNYSFILGGPMTDSQKAMFSARKNVTLLGSIAYNEISNFIRHCDVGFMPMNDHPFNQTRSPMKLYEFAAGGLPMVAKATSELERRNLPFCFTYKNFSEFCTAVNKALAYKSNGSSELQELAKAKSWDRITSQILEFCDEITFKTIGNSTRD